MAIQIPLGDPWLFERQQRDRDDAARTNANYTTHYPALPRLTPTILYTMQVPFKRLHPAAKPPSRAHATDAASDLYALPADGVDYRPLHPGERRLFRTGIALALPAGFYGHICDRSGNALKRGLHVLGGIVDAGFLGDVGVILLNTSQDPVWISPGERIAQIIVKQHESPTFVEVTGELVAQQSDRGADGFGSTGAN